MRLFGPRDGDVRPTPAGDFLIERARRLLFDARRLRRDVELFRDSGRQHRLRRRPYPAATLMPWRVLLRSVAGTPASGCVEINNWHLLHERLCCRGTSSSSSPTCAICLLIRRSRSVARPSARQPAGRPARSSAGTARVLGCRGVVSRRCRNATARGGQGCAGRDFWGGWRARRRHWTTVVECDDTSLPDNDASRWRSTRSWPRPMPRCATSWVDAGALAPEGARTARLVREQMGLGRAAAEPGPDPPTVQRVIAELEKLAAEVTSGAVPAM